MNISASEAKYREARILELFSSLYHKLSVYVTYIMLSHFTFHVTLVQILYMIVTKCELCVLHKKAEQARFTFILLEAEFQ